MIPQEEIPTVSDIKAVFPDDEKLKEKAKELEKAVRKQDIVEALLSDIRVNSILMEDKCSEYTSSLNVATKILKEKGDELEQLLDRINLPEKRYVVKELDASERDDLNPEPFSENRNFPFY